jgi:hypothetical protein
VELVKNYKLPDVTIDHFVMSATSRHPLIGAVAEAMAVNAREHDNVWPEIWRLPAAQYDAIPAWERAFGLVIGGCRVERVV